MKHALFICGLLLTFSGKVFSSGMTKGVTVMHLSTGQNVIIAEDKSLPICYLYAVLKSGYIWDPKKEEGLTRLVGRMLLRGTQKRTREELQDELDQLGAEIDVAVDAESLEISGATLKRNLDKFLEIFSDVILHPRFDANELAKEKRETIADLKQMRENDRALVRRFFKRELFDEHPYGMSADGRESTVSRVTEEKVKEFYKKFFVKKNVFFAASGDVDTNDLVQKLSDYFKSFPEDGVLSFPYPEVKKKAGLNIVLIDKPDRTQTQMMIGHMGIDIHHPDFFPLLVANNAFGGGFTSSLMQEVRVKRGWSYGAQSWYQPRLKPADFGIWVFPAQKDAVETIKLVLSLYENYANKGITTEEFERSKSNLINEYAFKIDTALKRVSQLVMMKLMDLPDDYLETYQEKVRAVTLSQVKEAIRKQADPQNLTMVIVCTASQIKRNLERELKKDQKKFQIITKSYKLD